MADPRRIEPELLDALPPDDPQAVGSRRDLRRINVWMRQGAIMARLLARYGTTPPRTVLELGGGDGTFMLGVARRLASSWTGVTLRLVDRQDLVSPETRRGFDRLGWTIETDTADVLGASPDVLRSSTDIVVANLLLHHFEASDLQALLARIARSAGFFAACEPRRSGLALAGSRMVFAIGCNAVSRHDAVTSVRAGFRHRELSELWPSSAGDTNFGWRLDETSAGLFTHVFTARREPRA